MNYSFSFRGVLVTATWAAAPGGSHRLDPQKTPTFRFFVSAFQEEDSLPQVSASNKGVLSVGSERGPE